MTPFFLFWKHLCKCCMFCFLLIKRRDIKWQTISLLELMWKISSSLAVADSSYSVSNIMLFFPLFSSNFSCVILTKWTFHELNLFVDMRLRVNINFIFVNEWLELQNTLGRSFWIFLHFRNGISWRWWLNF